MSHQWLLIVPVSCLIFYCRRRLSTLRAAAAGLVSTQLVSLNPTGNPVIATQEFLTIAYFSAKNTPTILSRTCRCRTT